MNVLSNHDEAPVEELVPEILTILLEDDVVGRNVSTLEEYVGKYGAPSFDRIDSDLIIRLDRSRLEMRTDFWTGDILELSLRPEEASQPDPPESPESLGHEEALPGQLLVLAHGSGVSAAAPPIASKGKGTSHTPECAGAGAKSGDRAGLRDHPVRPRWRLALARTLRTSSQTPPEPCPGVMRPFETVRYSVMWALWAM